MLHSAYFNEAKEKKTYLTQTCKLRGSTGGPYLFFFNLCVCTCMCTWVCMYVFACAHTSGLQELSEVRIWF